MTQPPQPLPPRSTGAAKPTPVRESLSEEGGGGADIALGGRPLEVNGVAWWAQELGWASVGRREDPGGVLLLVGFRHADDPEGEYRHEALLPCASLETLTEGEVEALLAEAGVFRPIAEEPPGFFGPPGRRRQRGGRREGPSGSRHREGPSDPRRGGQKD